MKRLMNNHLRRIGAILLLLAAVFAWTAPAGADAVPEETAAPNAAADAEMTQLQLSSSNYSVSIPRSYRNGEVTIEEIMANQVAYYFSPSSDMDFDVYQFSKPYPEMSLEDFTQKVAADFNGRDARLRTINGIDVGTYLSREFYDGVEYDVMSALIEDGSDYIEVVFWLDGETAVQEAEAILNSLSILKTYDLQLGTLPFCMAIPVGYRAENEDGEEAPGGGRTWYYLNENTPLDFDVYQWEKNGDTLEKYAIEQARAYEAERVEYRTVNDILLAYYYSYEEDQGQMYSVINYLFEDEKHFMKISFWLDGEIAVRQADRFLSTLRRTDIPEAVTEAD